MTVEELQREIARLTGGNRAEVSQMARGFEATVFFEDQQGRKHGFTAEGYSEDEALRHLYAKVQRAPEGETIDGVERVANAEGTDRLHAYGVVTPDDTPTTEERRAAVGISHAVRVDDKGNATLPRGHTSETANEVAPVENQQALAPDDPHVDGTGNVMAIPEDDEKKSRRKR